MLPCDGQPHRLRAQHVSTAYQSCMLQVVASWPVRDAYCRAHAAATPPDARVLRTADWTTGTGHVSQPQPWNKAEKLSGQSSSHAISACTTQMNTEGHFMKEHPTTMSSHRSPGAAAHRRAGSAVSTSAATPSHP